MTPNAKPPAIQHNVTLYQKGCPWPTLKAVQYLHYVQPLHCVQGFSS